MLVSRIRALGTRPVSPDYLERHQPHGISLERIRRDRILQEALATGADPLHLALIFNIDHRNARTTWKIPGTDLPLTATSCRDMGAA